MTFINAVSMVYLQNLQLKVYQIYSVSFELCMIKLPQLKVNEFEEGDIPYNVYRSFNIISNKMEDFQEICTDIDKI